MSATDAKGDRGHLDMCKGHMAKRGHATSSDENVFASSFFLHQPFTLGRAESFIRCYLAASPLAAQFVRGMRQRHPSWKLSLPSWDLQAVFRALCLPLLKPVPSFDLLLLSWKTAFLLTIA